MVAQNWQIPVAANNALTCYIPYCVYCLDSAYNSIVGFHDVLWKYFTDFPDKNYSQTETNKIYLGSTKLESLIKMMPSENVKKKKLTIVYAPHHSFGPKSHRVATWDVFGDAILHLAKQRGDIEWVLRPHPRFEYEVIMNKKATFFELYEYYHDWYSLGVVDVDSPWEIVIGKADILITDCISFLYDASILNCEVIHLRSIWQREPFSEGMMEIIGKYYQAYDLDQFYFAIEDAIKSSMYTKREAMSLPNRDYEENTSCNIYEYCNKVFGCR